MQISVTLSDEVFAFVQRAAERDCRTVGAQVRFYVTEACRKAGHSPNLKPWPPELPVITKENLPAIKSAMAVLQSEYDRLRRIEERTPTSLLPDEDAKLRFCRDRIAQLKQQIKPFEGVPA